jgi:DNA-binding PadR family transcriptional regulator
MRLEEIYQFFTKEPVTYLTWEQAVCYILSVLLMEESYGTELIQKLETEYPNYRLSDTVLYAALKFLMDEGALAADWKKVTGRGRPRRMYRLTPHWLDEAQKLAALWTEAIAKKQGGCPPVSPEAQDVGSQVAMY